MVCGLGPPPLFASDSVACRGVRGVSLLFIDTVPSGPPSPATGLTVVTVQLAALLLAVDPLLSVTVFTTVYVV